MSNPARNTPETNRGIAAMFESLAAGLREDRDRDREAAAAAAERDARQACSPPTGWLYDDLQSGAIADADYSAAPCGAMIHNDDTAEHVAECDECD